MAKKVFDVVATVGKYTDRNGQEKKRYVNVGAAFENDKGQLSIKIETIPVGPEWSGWLSLYEPKERSQGQPAAIGSAPAAAPAAGGDFSDDIPF